MQRAWRGRVGRLGVRLAAFTAGLDHVRTDSMTWQVVAASSCGVDTAGLSQPALTPMQRSVLLVTLVLFSALTAAALWQHGYWGILEPHFKSLGGAQVFVDLVIALALVMVWIWHDARATGRKVWPWIVLTLLAGWFGPLLYLLTRKPA
jgi:phosphate/sulfate permease